MSAVLYNSLCVYCSISSTPPRDATIVVKAERYCRVLFPFRYAPNQYQDCTILLIDLNLVPDHGHCFILNIEVSWNTQIHVRGIVIVRYIKYAFHVRIHNRLVGWITTKFKDLLIVFDQSKCLYVAPSYYFDGFGQCLRDGDDSSPKICL